MSEDIIIWYYKSNIDKDGIIRHRKEPFLVLKD